MGSQATRRLCGVGLGLVITCLASPSLRADDRLGAHFGAVFPLVTHVDGKTTNIGDDFKVGFPMGITVKKTDKFAFDLEIVPFIDPVKDGPTNVPLLIHPGVLRDLGDHFTLGLRMGFEIGGAAWGFTPLLNKAFPQDDHALFVEAVVPIRFVNGNPTGETHTAITFAVHVGVGF
jgi:hypothetical protein